MNPEQVLREIDFWKLVTVLVGLFAAYVAYRQYALGREKFKLDLFEKRFALFAGTRRFLTHILDDGNASLQHLFEFRASVAEATFLFDDDITDYLNAIDAKALQLWKLTETIRPLPAGQERTKAAGDISEAVEWLTNQLPELKIRFSPYLKFRRWA